MFIECPDFRNTDSQLWRAACRFPAKTVVMVVSFCPEPLGVQRRAVLDNVTDMLVRVVRD